MSLRDQVESFLNRQLPGSYEDVSAATSGRLVVAVSGGPDSLALLHLLAKGGVFQANRLLVAHFNHGLRPDASRDEAFVAETAAAWGLDYRSSGADVAAIAGIEKISIEEAARQARYRFLAEVALNNNATIVATGHNADDQAETVLMHFLRGSGSAGLRGMLPVGPLPGAPKVTLIRPLLSARSGQIRDYCRENALAPVIDETNEDVTIYRNRLRHELMPLLNDYNPNIVERLNNTAAVLAADYDLLNKLQEEAWSSLLLAAGQDWLELDLEAWHRLPLALRRSTLRHACESMDPALRDIGFQAVEQARLVAENGQVGASSYMPGGLLLSVGYDRLGISAPGAKRPPADAPQIQPGSQLNLPIPGRLELGSGWWIEARIQEEFSFPELVGNRDLWQACIDLGGFTEVVVRTRVYGERFQPLGMKGQSALISDVMVNRKIPAQLRAGWPVVAGRDHLLWLVGHHIDERARVTTESQRVLQLTVKRAP
jgi:tRNA(Ile)-lysidine synthase